MVNVLSMFIFFAIWDAVKEAENGASRFTFIPFVSCAYFVTVGIMYSSVTTINGVFIGPIWLPMLSVVPGLVIGLIAKKLLEVYIHKKNKRHFNLYIRRF